MTTKPSLAEQIGVIQGIAAQTRPRARGNSRDAYFAEQQIRSLEATEEVFLMNHADGFRAFMAGKEGK